MNELVTVLRGLGFDIESVGADQGDRALVARRDLGDRSILVTVDASGRFRVEITWLVGEWPSREVIGGVAVRIVDGVTRTVSVTGTVERLEAFPRVLQSLGGILPWATREPPAAPRTGSPPPV